MQVHLGKALLQKVVGSTCACPRMSDVAANASAEFQPGICGNACIDFHNNADAHAEIHYYADFAPTQAMSSKPTLTPTQGLVTLPSSAPTQALSYTLPLRRRCRHVGAKFKPDACANACANFHVVSPRPPTRRPTKRVRTSAGGVKCICQHLFSEQMNASSTETPSALTVPDADAA